MSERVYHVIRYEVDGTVRRQRCKCGWKDDWFPVDRSMRQAHLVRQRRLGHLHVRKE